MRPQVPLPGAINRYRFEYPASVLVLVRHPRRILLAKIVSDHGGVIEFESQPGRTVFKIMLPIVTAETKARDKT